MHIHAYTYPVISRRSSVLSENNLFEPFDPYVNLDPGLVIWHKKRVVNRYLWPSLVKIGRFMSDI